MSEISSALAHLLGHSDRADFLRDHWENAPLLVRAGLAGGPEGLLTLEEFSHLSFTGLAGPVSIVMDGTARPVDPHGDRSCVFTAYAGGCTLLASRVEQGWPPVARLCRALDLEFLALGVPLATAVSANAYLTPGRSRGFDLHYDNHCAFIIQLRGCKDWQVFSPVQELPLERCEQPLPRAELTGPLLDISLEPGDVLYLPRGFPHCASTGTESSLHLTVSVRAVTWAEAIGELCQASTPFRRSIPPLWPGPATAATYLEQTLKPRLAQLNLADYRERRIAEGLARLTPLPGNRFEAIDAAADVSKDTLVRRVHQMSCIASTKDGSAVLRFPGATLQLPAVMAPVFGFLAETVAFRPRELPQVNATYDAVELTRLLIRRGLLTPERASVAVDARSPVRPENRPSAATTEKAPDNATRGARDLTLVRSGEVPVIPHLDWLHARRPLTGVECDAVIAVCRNFPETVPSTVGQDRYPDRRRVISREVQANPETSWIFGLIEGFAAEAAKSHYWLSLTGIKRPPQYLEYQQGCGHFERHNDYSHEQADSPRKLTVIIQLSAPADYDGGRLQIHGMETDDLPSGRGSILVFPSFLYHSVTPVTRGVRRALVSWVAGPRLS